MSDDFRIKPVGAPYPVGQKRPTVRTTTPFALVADFSVLVSDLYSGPDELAALRRNVPHMRAQIDPAITDNAFQALSRRLRGGVAYRVRLFRLNVLTQSPQCITFLRSHGSILTGPYILSILARCKMRELFEHYDNSPIVSFAEEEALPQAYDGSRMIPYLYARGMRLAHFNSCWLECSRIVCVTLA